MATINVTLLTKVPPDGCEPSKTAATAGWDLGNIRRMNVRAMLFCLLMVTGGWQGWHNWRLRPVHPPDGLLAPDDPLQSDLVNAPAVVHGHWTLTPRARYDITARILSREDYSFDALADLVPEDLALGWGGMSDNRILRLLKIGQGSRFYSFRVIAPLPFSAQEAGYHSANTHVIPTDSFVRSQLAGLRVGQVVHLEGLLVDGVRADGYNFHTSLTRHDTGAGACEVMLVEHVEVQ
jgi:hypothetical protein